jgi:hypothetical protein
MATPHGPAPGRSGDRADPVAHVGRERLTRLAGGGRAGLTASWRSEVRFLGIETRPHPRRAVRLVRERGIALMRKPIRDILAELRSWLPNYDTGPLEYPTLLFRVLASLPGGEELEEVGYEAFNLGWHEADQLARVLDAIETKREVEDLVEGLLDEGGDD